MNEEHNLEDLPLDERVRLRKQLTDQAVKLAVSSRWEEAANVNREFLRLFGDEVEAYNRLGKALSEIGQITEARQSYSTALTIEPMNTIAKRNLDRLAGMSDSAAAASASSQLDTRLFIEETGKSTVASVLAVEAEKSQLIDAGDVVELEVQGNAVNLRSTTGEYIGMIEPRVGLRLAKMMAAGNEYTAAIVSTSGDMKVMIRETFQHPSQIGRVSFPQARGTDFRGYTRRGLVRTQDGESDYSDDDDHDDDDDRDGWSETNEDGEHTTVEVDVEPDDEGFD